jgi:hypothetical protein
MFMDYGLLKTPFEMIRRGVEKVKASIKPISMDDLAQTDKQKSRATEWLKNRDENTHDAGLKTMRAGEIPTPKKR